MSTLKRMIADVFSGKLYIKKLQEQQKSHCSFRQRQPFAEWKIDVEGIKYYHINFFSKIY